MRSFKDCTLNSVLLLVGSLGLLMIANELASGQVGGVCANNICNNISYDYNCANGDYTYYKLSDCLSCVANGRCQMLGGNCTQTADGQETAVLDGGASNVCLCLAGVRKAEATSQATKKTTPNGNRFKYSCEFHLTNDSKSFPSLDKWKQKGFQPDAFGRWVGPDDEIALPLYEGRMVGQFDVSQKGWVSGKGRSAV